MSNHQYVYHSGSVRLALTRSYCQRLANQASHRYSQKCCAPRRLLSLILPDRVTRRIFPSTGTPPISPIGHRSGSRATHHLDTPDVLVLHGYCVSPSVSLPPILIEGPSVSRSAHPLDTPDTLHGRRVSPPPLSLYGSWSRGIHLLDTSNVLHSTHPISLYGPWSRATHHLDTFNTLHGYRVGISPISIDGPRSRRIHVVHHASSCDTGSSYVPYLQPLLTLWAARVTINTLPDDVLLHIFHFDRITYLEDVDCVRRSSWRWHRLAHVSWRWRSVIFASPNFLNLRLVCGPRTRVGLTGIWPPLPIIIRNWAGWPMPGNYDFSAAIVHPNRVCEINLHHLNRWQLRRLASAMQEPFPALTHLILDFDDSHSLPAPLESLMLHSVTFPALPELLLFATNLVCLDLGNIPHSGYFPPEAIVVGLTEFANLKSLTIGFESPLSRPDWESRRPPPPKRTVLPALTRFEFKGVSEYAEDLVAQIDAPLLDSIYVTFFHQLIFDIPQLARLMSRTARLQALNEVHVDFVDDGVQVESLPPTRTFDEKSGLKVLCDELNSQLSSLAQVFTSIFPSIYTVEHLYIYTSRSRYLPSQCCQWHRDIENMQWLEILHPFTAVRNLYLNIKFAQRIAPALLVRERATDELPALENIFLEEHIPSGPFLDAIGQFVAARQLLGLPIAILRWIRT
jgi:hypothetical protein